MNRDKLNQALNEISDKHIAQAEKSRHAKPRWLIPIAAALAVILLITAFSSSLTSPSEILHPSATTAPTTPGVTVAPTNPSGSGTDLPVNLSYGRLSAPVYPKMAPYVTEEGQADYLAWLEGQNAQYNQPKGYAGGTEAFFRSSIAAFLPTAKGENAVCSPVNVYMALAVLAETADGQTRQQILDLLGADSIEALRTQAGHLWNAHYCSDGATTLTLGNSLWLDTQLTCNQDTADTLAEACHASVYHTDLTSQEALQTLCAWLNEQTGGLLSQQVQNLQLGKPRMVLASAIYYRVNWLFDFQKERNTQAVFHAPTGDATVTYMNQTLADHSYYWGEDFSAVQLPLKDGSHMWLILPEEGLTPADILTSGHAANLTLSDRSAIADYQSRKCLDIRLTVPKFDITTDQELSQNLMGLGIMDAFSPMQADFSAISPDALYIDQVKHAARVSIDEEGIYATAYTVIQTPNAVPPTIEKEKIDFMLDRPFLFIITSRDNLPLFAGVVNTP